MRRAAYKLLHAPASSRAGRTPGDDRARGPEGGAGSEPVPAEELARRLAVLAHPIRVGILQRLLASPSCVTDFVEALGEDQPKVSQHLKVLRDAGVIACRAEGRRRCYSVRQPRLLRQVLAALEAFEPGAVPAGEDDCSGDPARP